MSENMEEVEHTPRLLLATVFGQLMDALSGDAIARTLKGPLSLVMRRMTDENARTVLDAIVSMGQSVSEALATLDSAQSAQDVQEQPQAGQDGTPSSDGAQGATQDAAVYELPDSSGSKAQQPAAAQADGDAGDGASPVGVANVNGSPALLTQEQAARLGVSWKPLP